MSQDIPPVAILVAHRVRDHERWRAAYDAFDSRRKKLGIVGHAVHQELGRPDRVIVSPRRLGRYRGILDRRCESANS